jgi:hypothetical protein
MKETMKKVGTTKASSKDTNSQPRKATNEEKKRKGNKRSNQSKETMGEKEPHANKVVREKKKAKPQRQRSIPKAAGTHGCKHKGLMEL